MGAENSLFGFPKKTILVSRKQTEMPIDINLLRSFKGGIPDIVKLSQKNRFKDVSIVDRVISQDEVFFHFNYQFVAMEKTCWFSR